MKFKANAYVYVLTSYYVHPSLGVVPRRRCGRFGHNRHGPTVATVVHRRLETFIVDQLGASGIVVRFGRLTGNYVYQSRLL